MKPSLRRLVLGLLALVLVIAGWVVAAPFFISERSLRLAIESVLGHNEAMALKLTGDIQTSLSPAPTIAFGPVVLTSHRNNDVLATIPRIEAKLSLLPLLIGRAQVSGLTLHEAKFRVAINSEGRSNWDDVGPGVGKAIESGQYPMMTIRNGSLLLDDRASDQLIEIPDVNLVVGWPGLSSSLTLTGTMTSRNETLAFQASIADPSAIVRGSESTVSISGSVPTMKIRFDGRLTGGPRPQAVGTFAAESPSLRAFLGWLGHDVGAQTGSVLARFAVKGDAAITPGQLVIRRADLDLDGNAATGAITVRQDRKKLSIGGTLDATKLVFTSYFADMPLVPDTGGRWSATPVNMTIFTAADLDLRISAREVQIATVQLAKVGASITSRAGKLTLTVGEASAYGGTMRGSFTYGPEQSNNEMQAVLAAQRIDLGKGFAEWFGFRRFEGTGNIQLNIRARGTSIESFSRSLNGTASLIAIDGALNGINAEAILRRLERRPLAGGAGEARSGRTLFTRAATTIKIADGLATTSDLAFDGPTVNVVMEGQATLATRELDLKGVASLKRIQPQPQSNAFDLPFVVQGPWNDPFVLPDPDALIRRSQAAAPLLDRSRDRDAVRAVMDAIRQHSGGEIDIKPDNPAGILPLFPLILPPDMQKQ